ncbi:hypothetical protein HPB50_024949 [Hyalomma asiaticum]|uniref:Uncharacterized protein n=1 Tax=Hyalomma asiaticum TaxID=266040 RepID=A0ACB7TLS0_HYAAI|nr:hypothetical protein HPB50_024949 [Hyalomma asiaticum]
MLREHQARGVAKRIAALGKTVFMALSRGSNSKARGPLAQPRGSGAQGTMRGQSALRPVSAKRLSGRCKKREAAGQQAEEAAARDSEAKKRVKTGDHKFRFRRAARSAGPPRGKAQWRPPNARPPSPAQRSASREREIWSRAAGRFSRFGFIFLEEKKKKIRCVLLLSLLCFCAPSRLGIALAHRAPGAENHRVPSE